MEIAVYLHTHWDLEWYATRFEYREWLSKALKKVLDLLESGELRKFVLDGQVAPIEDYLALNPSERERIVKLVSEGKLEVGPWYTQPDEFLVSGESLIRNLLLGTSLARSLGKCMEVGYLPDTFGHIPQLPQILREFGIRYAVIWRGLGNEFDELGSEFVWRAPDGSEVLTLALKRGYFAFMPIDPVEQFYVMLLNTGVNGISLTFHRYYRELRVDVEEGVKKLVELARDIAECSKARRPLVPCGGDHHTVYRGVLEVLEKAREHGINVEVVGLSEYMEELSKTLDAKQLKVYSGELRGARLGHILSGVYSSRVSIKVLNWQAEKLIYNYLEPLLTIAWLLGGEYPKERVRGLVRKLLRIHFHDSIYGSGVDEVHLHGRSDLSQVISEARAMIVSLIGDIAFKYSEEAGGIAIFNPCPWRVKAPIKLYVPAHILRGVTPECLVITREDGSRYTLYLYGPENNALIYEGVLELEPTELMFFKLEMCKARKSETLKAEHSGDVIKLSNGEVEVSIDLARGGVLEITDLKSGNKYSEVLEFVDEGDVGDEYNFQPPEKQYRVSSKSFRARAVIVRATPEFSLARYKLVMKVPRSGEEGEAGGVTDLPIEVEVKLWKGVRRVDVTITLDNTAENHRLRVKLPKVAKTVKSIAYTPFYPIVRDHSVRVDDSKWFEDAPKTAPFQDWVAVYDGSRGIAVAAKGLYEYEVDIEDGWASLYVTLLRSVKHLSKPVKVRREAHAGPPIKAVEALEKGYHKFEISIVPLDKDPLNAEVIKTLYTFLTPPATCFVSFGGKGSFRANLIELEPGVLLSTVKAAESSNAIVARLVNLWGRELNTEVRLGELLANKADKAFSARADEKVLNELSVEKGAVAVKLRKHGVHTLLFEVKK